MFLSVIGAIGNLFFGFKSLFQVKANRKAKAFNCSLLMIFCDFIGNICCATYIAGTTGFWTLPWQFVNYSLATLFILILIGQYFKYKEPNTSSTYCNFKDLDYSGKNRTEKPNTIKLTQQGQILRYNGSTPPNIEMLDQRKPEINRQVSGYHEVLAARPIMNTTVKF